MRSFVAIPLFWALGRKRYHGSAGASPSVEALEAEFQKLKVTWGMTVARECRIPGKTLDQFCTELLTGL